MPAIVLAARGTMVRQSRQGCGELEIAGSGMTDRAAILSYAPLVPKSPPPTPHAVSKSLQNFALGNDAVVFIFREMIFPLCRVPLNVIRTAYGL